MAVMWHDEGREGDACAWWVADVSSNCWRHALVLGCRVAGHPLTTEDRLSADPVSHLIDHLPTNTRATVISCQQQHVQRQRVCRHTAEDGACSNTQQGSMTSTHIHMCCTTAAHLMLTLLQTTPQTLGPTICNTTQTPMQQGMMRRDSSVRSTGCASALPLRTHTHEYAAAATTR
jgi:hypothetical protein